MKMIYNGTPINSMKVKHYEISTNDCDMIASDLQAGKTAVAKGKKITGTGKAFSFAQYGTWTTNLPDFVPDTINVVQIGSETYPIKMIIPFQSMKTHNFASPQEIAEVVIDENVYPIIVFIQNGMLNITCDRTINIELFYAKDEYI